MGSIYDNFRKDQKHKELCHDERSAAFITQGDVSNEILHARINEHIYVGLIYNDKEGPDDLYVYAKKEFDHNKNFRKGDYFALKDTFYLIYETVQQSNKSLPYNKYRAVECNVSFIAGEHIYKGAFFSNLRRRLDTDFLRSSTVASAEDPYIIVPDSDELKIDIDFVIDNKPWKVKDYDKITNKGIAYLYIEQYFVPNNTEEDEGEQEPEIEVLNNFENPFQQEEFEEIKSLSPMVEYNFTTADAYFVSSPKVEILQRNKTNVKIKIPYGISGVTLSTKLDSGQVIEKFYKVVR